MREHGRSLAWERTLNFEASRLMSGPNGSNARLSKGRGDQNRETGRQKDTGWPLSVEMDPSERTGHDLVLQSSIMFSPQTIKVAKGSILFICIAVPFIQFNCDTWVSDGVVWRLSTPAGRRCRRKGLSIFSLSFPSRPPAVMPEKEQGLDRPPRTKAPGVYRQSSPSS